MVTDYFTKAGVLGDLEALGFDLVGYGCTTCLAAGTPVLLANGTTRRIERLPAAGGVKLFGPMADCRLATATQTEMMVQGEREYWVPAVPKHLSKVSLAEGWIVVDWPAEPLG